MKIRPIESDRMTAPDHDDRVNNLAVLEGLEIDESNAHLRGDDTFNGPVGNRKCTDTPFLIAFAIGNIVLLGLSIYVFIIGDPNRLLRGFDFRADICGIGSLNDRRFMYWPEPSNMDWSLCIHACPYYYMNNYYCIYDDYNTSVYLKEWGCWDAYESTSYGFYCIPTAKSDRENVIDELGKPMTQMKIASGDLVLSWDSILLGGVLSIVIGFLYLSLFRKAHVIKKIIIFSICLLAGLIGYFIYLWVEAANKIHKLYCESYGPASPEYCETSNYNFYIAIAALSGFFGLLYLYQIYLKYQKFNVGINMIVLTCRPLHNIKELFFFPAMQIIVGLGIMMLLALVICWTFSTGTIVYYKNKNVPGGEANKIEFRQGEVAIFAYNALISAWWLSFMADVGFFVLAGGVSTWYYSRQKDALYMPLWKSFKTCLRYHLGSIAFGSFARPFVAIPCWLIRPFEKMKLKAKDPMPKSTKFITDCCFCIKYYHKYLRFLTKYSYIYLSIFADPYFRSSKRSYFLMRRNYFRIGKPAAIGSFIISIVQYVITLSGMCLTLSLILLPDKTASGQLTIEIVSTAGPALFTFLISWFIGKSFAGALDISLNTVLLSAASDEEMFTREQRFAEKDLIDFMDGIGEEQNEFHREEKMGVRIENRKLAWYEEDENIILNEDQMYKKDLYSRDADSSSGLRATMNSPASMLYPATATSTVRNPVFMDEIVEESVEEDPNHHYVIGREAKYVGQ